MKDIGGFEFFHFSKKGVLLQKKGKEFAVWKVKAFCQQKNCGTKFLLINFEEVSFFATLN